MKIVFNDATELQIQKIQVQASELNILVLASVVSAEGLKEIFDDPIKTRKMIVKEREETLHIYEGYTTFYRTETYEGGILGVTNYKPDETPEAQADILISSVKVAKIQAQNLDDTDAMEVKNLYPEWNSDGEKYALNYKVNYNGILYKCLQEHTSQSDWDPEAAVSLWAKVLISHPGTIPDWEQPSSTNPYMRGDKVRHTEKIWISEIDNNVWKPGAAGSESLWSEVSE